jgi:DNA-binding PadR family transcriptional regulator
VLRSVLDLTGDDQDLSPGDRLYLNSGTLTPLLKRIEALGLISRLGRHRRLLS